MRHMFHSLEPIVWIPEKSDHQRVVLVSRRIIVLKPVLVPGYVLFGSWEQNPDMGNLWGFYRLHGYYFGDPYISGLAL